ncbi:related to TGF beta induced protein ig-h3 precursor [Rhynchosporium agropyri]|uniref:Related to TGF beta induced protein ig-h3 n=2 Tax=Rhynchosporium TaxID=38037 RepID=A0A1E1M5T5_RHYSE|nr:related to TGF beta induced protein ig-h3 precursor [Rhynchosporium agropyri]CZT43955.1 related to TGF beta induced protein ig-h3 precursor [Rhynchosporium secalis]
MYFSSLICASALAASAAAQMQMSLMDLLMANNKTLGTLTGLLEAHPSLMSGLTSAQNITILAPSNDAFSTYLNTPNGKLASSNPGQLTALLQYHVLMGTYMSSSLNTSIYAKSMLTNATYANVTGGQVVKLSKTGDAVLALSGNREMSKSTTKDVAFQGGVVHVLDKVLTMPMMPSHSALDSNLTALAGALTASSLIAPLDAMKDLTIFAPSNAAFDRIGSALPMLAKDKSMLMNVLEYHVVNGTIGYAGTLGNMTLTAAQGGKIKVEVVNKKVFVNSAQVIISDVIIANGVVHVIDNVLNPANPGATPNPTATTQTVAFTGVTMGPNPFTSGITPTATAPSASTSTAAADRDEGAMSSVAYSVLLLSLVFLRDIM